MASLQTLNPLAATAGILYGTAGSLDLLAGLQTDFFTGIMANHMLGMTSLPLTLPAAGAFALSVVNHGHKDQSRLSANFATAASFAGIFSLAGAMTPITNSVLPVFVCYAALAVSGAASLTSYLTRNTHLKVSVQNGPKP